MTLMERIGGDITAAMRTRDQARLMPLRMAKAALMNKEVEKGRPLEDAEAMQVIASLIKQRRDSIEQFRQGGREDLVTKETAEIAILDAYLPPPVDPQVIERAVDEAIAETGATSAKDLGKVMKGVMPKLTGHAVDGRTVNEMVRRKLGAS
ncbi:MAG: GatB/YqeY domain-containing protein [Acidobacteria bacterium]|nr:GatB/YqeY domain-containing protein [Acidobacteriota bacterium]